MDGTSLYSLTEHKTQPSLTVLAELPSFRHTVLRVSNGSGTIFYAKEYGDNESFLHESSVLDIIHRANQPFVIPRIVHQDVQRKMNLLSEVKGAPIDSADFNPSLISYLAKHLKGFHDSVKPDDLPALNYQEQLDLFEELIMPSDQISSADKQIVANALLALKSFFQKPNDDIVAVHGDFNKSNVLYDREAQRFGLIDFERTGKGYRSTDIARAAWRLLDNDPEKVRILLEEYYETSDLTAKQWQEFYALQGYDYIGAVAYYAKEGYKNKYPYFQGAIENLKIWPKHI